MEEPYRPSQHYYQPTKHILQHFRIPGQPQQPEQPSRPELTETGLQGPNVSAQPSLHPVQYAWQHGRLPDGVIGEMSAGYVSRGLRREAQEGQGRDDEMEL